MLRLESVGIRKNLERLESDPMSMRPEDVHPWRAVAPGGKTGYPFLSEWPGGIYSIISNGSYFPAPKFVVL